jgi:serine/threonine protein kinase
VASDGQDRLLALAGEVADERGVDWESARSSNPDLDSVLQGLERLQVVAASYREVRRGKGERDSASSPDEVLFQWGHLQVLEELGTGSYGEVYRAWDSILARAVALKLRRPGPGESRSSGRHYIQEARRLARVRHPNVLTIFGADLHDGRIGLWTELVRGRTLDDQLAEQGTLGPREALGVGIDLCRALAAVHGAKLVHGDVKAANVLREEGGRIVLADFGAGSELEGADSAGGAVRGTPLSTAPEVLLEGRVGPRADLYSLGALLYRLVSGRHSVEAEDLGALLASHRAGEIRPLRDLRPDLPAAFVAVVERALSADPRRRHGSAGAMEQALVAALQEAPEERSAGADSQRRAQRPLLAWAASIAGVTLVLAGLSWIVRRDGEQSSVPLGSSLVSEVAGEAGDAPPRAVESATTSSPNAPLAPMPEADRPAARPAADPVAPSAAGDGATGPEETVPGPRSLVAHAALFRDRGGARRPLAAKDRVAPGDLLSLELDTEEQAFLYVLNEDDAGELFVLFPLAGLPQENPLAPGRAHRLPAADQDWQVTSAGGTETFLVVASRERLTALEADLEALQAAAEGRPVRAAGEAEVLRGVGGLVPSTQPRGRLAALALDLLRRQEEAPGSLWVRRFEVRNPSG